MAIALNSWPVSSSPGLVRGRLRVQSFLTTGCSCAVDIRLMHLHFVQSLEPLQGAGLGQAALSLHLAMRGAPLETGYIPVIDPASATVEEMDEWILAQGGQPISPEELKDFVAQAQWADGKRVIRPESFRAL